MRKADWHCSHSPWRINSGSQDGHGGEEKRSLTILIFPMMCTEMHIQLFQMAIFPLRSVSWQQHWGSAKEMMDY